MSQVVGHPKLYYDCRRFQDDQNDHKHCMWFCVQTNSMGICVGNSVLLIQLIITTVLEDNDIQLGMSSALSHRDNISTILRAIVRIPHVVHISIKKAVKKKIIINA